MTEGVSISDLAEFIQSKGTRTVTLTREHIKSLHDDGTITVELPDTVVPTPEVDTSAVDALKAENARLKAELETRAAASAAAQKEAAAAATELERRFSNRLAELEKKFDPPQTKVEAPVSKKGAGFDTVIDGMKPGGFEAAFTILYWGAKNRERQGADNYVNDLTNRLLAQEAEESRRGVLGV